MTGDFEPIRTEYEPTPRSDADAFFNKRKAKRKDRFSTDNKRSSRVEEDQRNSKIASERDARIEAQNEKLKVDKANRDQVKDFERQDSRERTDGIVNNARDTSNERSQENKTISDERDNQKAKQRKNNIESTFNEGNSNRENKENITINQRERTASTKETVRSFFDRIGEQRSEAKQRSDHKRKIFQEREDYLFRGARERKNNIKASLQDPFEFNEKIQAAKNNIVIAAQERAEKVFAAGGDPAIKRETFQANKAEIVQNAKEKLEPVQELFDAAFARFFEIIKAQVGLAYEKGDIHREEKNAIVEKARETSKEFVSNEVLRRRWKNLFQVQRTDERFLRFIVPFFFHEFYSKLQEALSEGRFSFNRYFEKFGNQNNREDFAFKQQEDAPYNRKINQNILHFSDLDSSPYENHLDEILQKNQHENSWYIDTTKAEDNFINYLDEFSEKYPSDRTFRENDRTSLSSPMRNPHLEPKEIITYIDDSEKLNNLEERENTAYFEEMKERLALEDSKVSEDEIQKAQEAIKSADKTKSHELQKYLERIVEDQNKSAHDKAVELGQLINLFF